MRGETTRTGRVIETFWQDVRYGWRVLRRNTGFSVAAILTLALGIGANTAIFSLVYGVLLRPLPYHNGSQLVVLHQLNTKAAIPDIPFSVKELADYSQQNQTLQGIVEHHQMSFLLSDSHTADRVEAAVVSGNFFDVLGVRPILGRTFIDADDQTGAPPVIVLSNKYWRERQAGDPNIVGKVFRMNSKAHTVIGVLPPVPQYPVESDLYLTTVQCPTRSSPGFKANRKARMMTAFARLKPDVPLDQAQRDLSVVAGRIANAYRDVYPGQSGYALSAVPLRDDLTHTARTTFFVLLAGSGFVLLIACANVANLMLARLLRLRREMAVRAALGASRGRLLRQLLTESMLISFTGGILGLSFAPLALSVLVKFASRYTTRATEVQIDAPVLLFTLLMAVGTGIIFGLAPAFSSSAKAGEALKQGGGRNASGRGARIVRNALVVTQVAVSFVLLIGAGLMLRSFVRMSEVNPGFRTDHLLSMRLTPNGGKYGSHVLLSGLTSNITRHIKAIAGVDALANASNVPLSPTGIASGPGNVEFTIAGQPLSQGALAPLVDITAAGPTYFSTIGQPLIAGRSFNEHDDDTSPAVAIVNQSMVHHRWPTTNPIGQRVAFSARPDSWYTIVGVVGDTREYGLATPAKDEIYLATAQQGGFSNKLIVRTGVDPAALTPLIREAIREVDPFIAIDQLDTLEHFQYESMAPPRVTATLMGIFAALALLISTCGIAAVMMLSVTQQTRELGIRMAIGAHRGKLVADVLRQGLFLAMIGIAAGVSGALALTRLLSTLLYATSPTDVTTFVAVSALFLAVAGAACFVPARQVTAIDPMIALREQ